MTTLLSEMIFEIHPAQASRPVGARRGGDGAPQAARTTPAAHVAPFQFTSLARALRPRTGRGRHVSAAVGARHRGPHPGPRAGAPARA